MKFDKFVILFFTILSSQEIVFSQIGGISASKLAVINTGTVPANKIEFEPAFNFTILNSDSLQTSSDFGFRFTYGLNEKTEIGIALPVNMSDLNWGIKYHAVDFNKLSLGIIAGIKNALVVNKSEALKHTSFFNFYAVGLVSTYQINNKLSIDFDGQIQNHFHYSKQDIHLFLNSEIGYFIANGLQIVSGIQYENNFFRKTSEENFILNSGVTIEKAENFILVLNFPYKLENKKTENTLGFSLALTILID